LIFDPSNKELAALVRDRPDSHLGEIMSRVLSASGKRVRPPILIISCSAGMSFYGEEKR